MTGPTGRSNPDDQKRIEELRQHIQELYDEMTFYQIRFDSLAKEGNPDAWRELRVFDEGFSELEAEILDLQHQLHELEFKASGDQRPFSLPEESSPTVDRSGERAELIRLQKEEEQCLEKYSELERQQAEGLNVDDALSSMRRRLEWLRKEIIDIHDET